MITFDEFASQPELQATTVSSGDEEIEEEHSFIAYINDIWESERRKQVFLVFKKSKITNTEDCIPKVC